MVSNVEVGSMGLSNEHSSVLVRDSGVNCVVAATAGRAANRKCTLALATTAILL